MKKHYLILSFFIIFIFSLIINNFEIVNAKSIAKQNIIPFLPKQAKNLKAFIPKNWKLLKKVKTDLLIQAKVKKLILLLNTFANVSGQEYYWEGKN